MTMMEPNARPDPETMAISEAGISPASDRSARAAGCHRKARLSLAAKGPDFSAEIAALEGLDLGDLRVWYRRLIRKAPPAHLSRWILLRIVAYELQAKVLGDLDPETKKLLAGLAKDHEADLKARAKAERAGTPWTKPAVPKVPAVSTSGRLAIGTGLVREFGGELHRVTVTESGFIYQGRSFTSLSQIARLMTGTNWNGPYFFGLRDKSGAQVLQTRPAPPSPQSPSISDDRSTKRPSNPKGRGRR